MPNVNPWDKFFYPTLTLMIDSYILSHPQTKMDFGSYSSLNSAILYLNKLPEVPEYDEMQYYMITLWNNLWKGCVSQSSKKT